MNMQSQALATKIHPGSGRIDLSLHANRAVFSELSSTYPLKLLSPHVHDETAIVYMLTYGGGLVGGDEISLVVNVQAGARLVLLSQGSTKIFKTRLGKRLASVDTKESHTSAVSPLYVSLTKQNNRCVIAPRSMLLLLPEPVTCFRDASYNQIQRFDIMADGSAVILDWITSGRISLGEEWVFSRYYSVNEIWHDGKRILKDVMLLDSQELGVQLPERPLRKRLLPYSCYGMLILYGPQVRSVVADITAQYNQISVFKTKSPSPLIWSLSPIDSTEQGVVVRVAGLETETVKSWLRQALLGLEDLVGKDVYRRVFS
ncbi:UreD urease accessory protein-domain-containing protein [Crassisporium funariophilum]|nr:UreD urease accessory protein-domain-containing protein [Crassisporium funariophilum]